MNTSKKEVGVFLPASNYMNGMYVHYAQRIYIGQGLVALARKYLAHHKSVPTLYNLNGCVKHPSSDKWEHRFISLSLSPP